MDVQAYELEAMVETIVAQSMPRPRAAKRIATTLGGTPPTRIATGEGPVGAWRIGEGPALLMAHGANDDHILWAPLMDAALKRGHAVVALDMPGYGHSGEAERSEFGGAAAILDVGKALGPIHTVVGHSIGAVAVIRALTMGLDARKAALFATALPTQWDLWILERDIVAPAGTPPVVMERVRQRLKAPPVGAQFDFDVEAAARALRIPGLLIHSKDDPHWSWRTTEVLASQWPGARAHYVEGLGHRTVARDAAPIRALLDFVEAD